MFPVAKFAGSGIIGLRLGSDSENVVRVVYSDESGTGSEHDEPLTIVAGLMLNLDSQWHPVLELVESALFDYRGEKNPPNYEIKGRDLYSWIRKGNAEAAKFMAALMRIPSLCYVPIFYGAVDRAGFRQFSETYRPFVTHTILQESPDLDPSQLHPSNLWVGPYLTFSLALRTCIIQVESYVCVAFPKEQVLWIHDKGRYDDRVKENLNDTREDIRSSVLGASAARQLTDGAPLPATSHIVDTIYFGESQESRAIQLADVYCSTIARHLRGDPIAAPYYELLRQQIINPDRRPEYADIK